MGATQDQYDCIDFSDNEITKLEGFPRFLRLKTLFFNNNRITRIASDLGQYLPHLETLILTNNKLNNLSDIDSLSNMPSLTRLCLLENLITKKQHYRLYVIHKLPKLKLLDFRKIKQMERIASTKLFGAPKDISQETKPTNAPIHKTPLDQYGHTPEEVQAIKSAITNISSMEEYRMMERSLAAGQIPQKENSSKMDI